MYTHTPLVKKSWRSSQDIKVILGSHTVKAFVTSPKVYEVIGIIKRGMEFGLLAVKANGEFVRVNGSLVQALNQTEVMDAIAMARAFGRGESFAESRESQHVKVDLRRVPVVAIRKHRKIDCSLISSAEQFGREVKPSVSEHLDFR